MYLSHFGLREKPFKISTDPKFLWLGEKHKEALETLRYGILHNDGYVVVTGNVGTGKTTLATALLMDLSNRIVAGTVSLFDVVGLDFLNLIALAYGLSNTFQSKTTFLAHFMSCLRNAVAEGKKVVLIVDEAQRLIPEHLKELLHLSNIEENGTRLLNLIFVGQNEFNDVLMEETNKALRQRVTVNYNLAPLTLDETRRYIVHRLKIAQCKRELFTREAVEETFVVTKGIPRLINTVCDRALLITYFQGRKKVRPEAIRESVQQLRLPNEGKEFLEKEPEFLSRIDEKIGNEIGQKIRGESRTEIVANRAQKRPRARSAYVVALGALVVVVGIIFLLDRDGYLQQYLNPEELQEKVSRKITPARTENEILKQDRVPEVAPFAVEKTAFSDSTGKGADSSTLKKDFNDQEEANVPKPKASKVTSVRAVEKEKAKPKPKTVPLRSSVGQSGQALTGSLPEERSSSKREESLGDKEKPALDFEKKISQSPPSKTSQSAAETSSNQLKEVEPDKVIDWLLERRSGK